MKAVQEWPPNAGFVPLLFRQQLAQNLKIKSVNDRRFMVGRWITRVRPGTKPNPDRESRPLTSLGQAKGYWALGLPSLKEALPASGAIDVKEIPSPVRNLHCFWFRLP